MQNFAAPPIQGSSATPELLTSVLSMVVQALIQKLSGQIPAGPNPDNFGALGADATAPTPTLTNTTKNADDKASLDDSLAEIAKDPDGAKLLAKAEAAGVKISAGDPDAAIGANDILKSDEDPRTASKDGNGTVVNGVTLSDSDGGNIRVVVHDPKNIKTIVHELVHAVSTGDGNSKEEEGIADVIGSRVANRLGGADVGGLTGSDETIYKNKQKLYPELKQTNDIRETLLADGLSVDV